MSFSTWGIFFLAKSILWITFPQKLFFQFDGPAIQYLENTMYIKEYVMNVKISNRTFNKKTQLIYYCSMNSVHEDFIQSNI